jgi:hypothetical protein
VIEENGSRKYVVPTPSSGIRDDDDDDDSPYKMGRFWHDSKHLVYLSTWTDYHQH